MNFFLIMYGIHRSEAERDATDGSTVTMLFPLWAMTTTNDEEHDSSCMGDEDINQALYPSHPRNQNVLCVV